MNSYVPSPTLAEAPAAMPATPGIWRRGDLSFTASGGWWELRRPLASAAAPDAQGDLGRPGLWRRLPAASSASSSAGSGAGLFEVFESPVIPPGEDAGLSEDAADPLAGWLEWAYSCMEARPEAWQPPPKAEVESWIGTGEPMVRAGSLIRRGSLICEPGRLALRLPVLPPARRELSPPRAAWLAALLEDAALRWRMVRLGRPQGDPPASVLAEVDFTGAPSAQLPELLRTGVHALRLVAEWLAPSADFLAGDDPSRALEICPPRV